jgi:hypothetical protein
MIRTPYERIVGNGSRAITMRRLFLPLLALMVLAALPAAGDWKAPNVLISKWYRLFKFHPEARVSEYRVRNFDSIKIFTAYRAGEENTTTFEDTERNVIKFGYQYVTGTYSRFGILVSVPKHMIPRSGAGAKPGTV